VDISYLEQTGELGVPVGDVLGLAVHEGGDHVAQGGQRQVDLGRLLITATGPGVKETVARDFA